MQKPKNLPEFLIKSIIVRNNNRDVKFKEMAEKIRKNFCIKCDEYVSDSGNECKSCHSVFCNRHEKHISAERYCIQCRPDLVKECSKCPRKSINQEYLECCDEYVCPKCYYRASWRSMKDKFMCDDCYRDSKNEKLKKIDMPEKPSGWFW